MAHQQKVVYSLSNGAILNNLEQFLTQFSTYFDDEYLINV